MKISQNKNRRIMTIILAIMLASLLAFSLLPLVSSVIQASQTRNAPGSPLAQPSLSQPAPEIAGYELVLQREPDNINAWRGLLEAHLRQGNLAAAIAPLEKLTQLEPQSLDYGLLLAQTQQYLKNEAVALATYQNLLASHPLNIQVLKGLVDLQLAQQRPQDAIQQVQASLAQALEQKKLNPNNPALNEPSTVASLQLLLGEIYGQQNRESEAIAIYTQAIQENPQDFRPPLAKALLLQKANKTTEADALFATAIRLAPVQYKDEIKKLAVQSVK